MSTGPDMRGTGGDDTDAIGRSGSARSPESRRQESHAPHRTRTLVAGEHSRVRGNSARPPGNISAGVTSNPRLGI